MIITSEVSEIEDVERNAIKKDIGDVLLMIRKDEHIVDVSTGAPPTSKDDLHSVLLLNHNRPKQGNKIASQSTRCDGHLLPLLDGGLFFGTACRCNGRGLDDLLVVGSGGIGLLGRLN